MNSKDLSGNYYLSRSTNIKPYKWYSCTDCNYHFRSKDDLNKHYWIVHNKGSGKTYHCELCDKTFRCSNLYNKHRIFHNYIISFPSLIKHKRTL